MKYVISPEFHRNLWLRFSPFSLISAPVILVFTAFICAYSGGNNVPDDAGMGLLANVMLTIYFIVVIVAGNYEAGTALQDEVRNNTWDFQRMSSISAAKLAFGKLFGATSYHWYFGLMTLAFFAYGYEHYQVQPYYWSYQGGPPKPEPVLPDGSLPVVLVYLVLAGLIGHVLAFVSGFYDMMSMAARGGTRGRAPKGVNAFILGLICSGWVFATIAMNAATHLVRGRPPFGQIINWLGESWPTALFVPLSLLFFLGWFMAGAYRLARAELMHRQTPVVWLAFCCTSVFWATGFMHAGGDLAMNKEPGYFLPLLMSFILMSMITYCTMLNESSDARRYGRFWDALKLGQLKGMLENAPKWIVTAPVALALYVWFIGYASGLPVEGASKVPEFACMLLALILFMLRDGFAVHAIHLGVRRRGVGFVILFYYVMAYVVLPLVAFVGMGEKAQNMLAAIFDQARGGHLRGIAGFFFPLYAGDPTISVFPGLLEAGIAGGVLFWALGKRHAAITEKLTENKG